MRAWKRPNSATEEKCARQSRSNSRARYSCTCHGLSERSAPFGASVSTLGVERYTAPDPTPRCPGRAALTTRDEPAEVLERRAGVLQVLDRLQEHHGVGGLGEGFDQVALEAQVRAPVAQPGVLVRLGVGVDADDARRAPREHVGAVALAAGHVDHVQAADARGDPLVDDEMAAEPVVLLRHVRERALARQRQRGTSSGWSRCT